MICFDEIYEDSAERTLLNLNPIPFLLPATVLILYNLRAEGAALTYSLACSRHEIWIQGRLIVADEMTIIRSTPEEREREGAGVRAYASDERRPLLAEAPPL